jgi:hypothetical protein
VEKSPDIFVKEGKNRLHHSTGQVPMLINYFLIIIFELLNAGYKKKQGIATFLRIPTL